MKRIAALSLVAALAATGVSADTSATVSTQGLGGTAVDPALVVGGFVAVATIIAVIDSSSSSQ